MGIELLDLDFTMSYFVTRAELIEINDEARRENCTFTLSDEQIASIPADSRIQVCNAARHTSGKGEAHFRVDFEVGTLDVTATAWEKILQNGERASPQNPWM
jgi:hypothetical protein